jgi:hypothetical protein
MALLMSGGCSSSPSGDDGAIKPGSGVALNPSGKPQSQQEANYAAQMQKTGEIMNQGNQKMAAAMAAAKARTGGK